MQINPPLDRPGNNPESEHYRIPGEFNSRNVSPEELAQRAYVEALQQLPSQEAIDVRHQEATEHASEYHSAPEYDPAKAPERARQIGRLIDSYRSFVEHSQR